MPTTRSLPSEHTNVGRGWEHNPLPVPLEPPFERPLLAPGPSILVDDGRLPTFTSRLFGRGEPRMITAAPPTEYGRNIQPRLSTLATGNHELAFLRTHLPPETKTQVQNIEPLLVNIANSAEFVSFEMIGTGNEIFFQFATGEHDLGPVRFQLEAHLPDLEFRTACDGLELPVEDHVAAVAVSFGLAGHWFIPLPHGTDLALDPLTPLVAAFESLQADETACLQVMFARTRSPWPRSKNAALFDSHGKPIYANFSSQQREIREKLSGTLAAVCIRLLVHSRTRPWSLAMARRIMPFFKQYGRPSANALIPLQAVEDDHSEVLSVLARTTHRSGMLLTFSELASLVRFPSNAIRSPKLRRTKMSKRAPATAGDASIVIGRNEHAGESRLVKISPASHGLVIGGTGTGKSTLLMNTMLQHVEQDLGGLIAIDPHGDLIDDLVARMPPGRADDVILFDAADPEYAIGFNILEAHSETEKTFLASDLIATFRRFASTWGDIMDSILANAVLAFVESSRGGTLFDLKRFLVEKRFRSEFLETVEDEAVRYYWTYEFPSLPARTLGSILVRLDAFLRQKLIRNIVCQKDSKLDLRRIFDERKILLVKLAQGMIGEENAALLGTLLISKIYQIALTRQDVDRDKRSLTACVIDEASHLTGAAPSMSLILNNLRKYGISLTLATQHFGSVRARDTTLADSILANCQTRICFRLGDKDAEAFAKGFSFFDATALQNLATGEAIARLEKAENDFNLETLPAPEVATDVALQRRKAIVENTRKLYATRIQDIDRSPYAIGSTSKPLSSGAMVIADETTSNSDTVARSANKVPVSEEQAPPEPMFAAAGAHHQELQKVVARMAEHFGFAAEIEKSLPDGGRVDVSVEGADTRIACEISVTTTDYEDVNTSKCVSAGYDLVVIVAANEKKIPLLESKLRDSMVDPKKVRVLSLSGFLALLREMTVATSNPGKALGQKSPGHRLSFAEGCELLDVSPSTLYRWIKQGKVPFYRLGREYQFDRDELLLLGKHDHSGKQRGTVTLPPLRIDRPAKKGKKEQDSKYRKLLKLD